MKNNKNKLLSYLKDLVKNDKKIAFELLSVNKISLAIIMWVCEHIN